MGKIPWRRTWQPTPVSMPEKFQGQRSLAGYTVHGVTRNGQNLATKPHQHHPILAPDSHQSVLYNSAISRVLYRWNHICNLLGLGFPLSMILWRAVLCINGLFLKKTKKQTPTDCFSLSPVHLQNKVNKNKVSVGTTLLNFNMHLRIL